MICQECKAAGQKSRVNSHGGTATLMGYSPYYDEEGVYHNHDSNRRTSYYSCSNGHHWVTIGMKTCPADGCDFGGVTETRPIEGPKKSYPAKDFCTDDGILRVGPSEVIPMAVDRTDNNDE